MKMVKTIFKPEQFEFVKKALTWNYCTPTCCIGPSQVVRNHSEQAYRTEECFP